MALSLYLASPLGFSEAGRTFYIMRFKPRLQRLGFELIDPWELTSPRLIAEIERMPFGEEKRQAWAELNPLMGQANEDGINRGDGLVAVLDGVDVDSGTASEVGYGYARGKRIFGYRSDFRLSADNLGSTVNLQVEHFIRRSGGWIDATIEALETSLKTWRDSFALPATA